jgi:SAM-dependent methyltransferase
MSRPLAKTSIEDWIAKFVADARPGRVLDVGCGTRPYEQLFEGWDYIGIDVEDSGRPGHNKQVDRYFDGLTIPFDDASFEAVVCTEVLEHCVDEERLASEMLRVLRPDGKAVITVPFMWGEHELPFDFRRYSVNGISRLLESVGFDVLQIERSQPGIDAIAALVASEINNSIVNVDDRPPSVIGKTLRRVEPYLWVALRRLWGSQYSFQRVYIDNLVIARRRMDD